MKTNIPFTDQKAKGRFKVSVIDASTKNIVHQRQFEDNLILDQGLNYVCSSATWQACVANCVVGTGTTPTYTDSGIITATTSGTTCTASDNIFSASDASGTTQGRIVFDSGEEAYITGYTSAKIVTLSATLGVSTGTLFTIYRVKQVGLTTEFDRATSSNYVTGGCDSSVVKGATTMWRTWDFPVIELVDGDQTFTELGWSWSDTAGNNLFSRALISGGGVNVYVGQQLRILYELEVSWGPTDSVAAAPTITGWAGTDGDYIMFGATAIEYSGIQYVDTSGAGAGSLFCEPSSVVGQSIYLCTGSTLPTGYNQAYTSGTTYSGTLTLNTYTANTFTRSKKGYWTNATVSAVVRGLLLGTTSYGVVFVFDNNMDKDDLHTLTINWPIVVGRSVTNP